jgi:hypothetical protein
MQTRAVFYRAAVVLVAVLLSSCDLDPFGFTQRSITREYYMMQTDDPDVYALASRSENGGPVISEIGWREPLIIARSSGDARWQVVDTKTKQHDWVSDQARGDDPNLRQIQIYSAGDAWKQLR